MTIMTPKRLGDELDLDEYNACQYLLYNMDCWNEDIVLNTDTSYQGKYATYQFKSNNVLRVEKQESYRINSDLTNTNSTFTIQLTSLNANLNKLNILPSIELDVRLPQKYKDANGNEKDYDPTDFKDIPYWSINESKSKENKYTRLIPPCTYDETTKQIQFKLYEGKALLPTNTIFSRTVKIRFKFNSKPYVDFRNGKANTNDEILVDNAKELEKLVRNVPKDEFTIFRLDSNIDSPAPARTSATEPVGTYFLSNPLIIKNGQNIEIRGGTIHRARINASISKRCFIVEPGGKLSLKNIICEYGNCFNNAYKTGRGGAILIEHDYYSYGVLECYNCVFENNIGHYGGAIFSFHGGLFLDKCTFTNNRCIGKGGAIYYQAKDATLKMENILTKVGATPTITVSVRTTSNQPINEGKVDFYIRKNNTDEYIGSARVRSGEASVTYTVPNEIKTIEYPIIAIYRGGRSIDDETVVATMKIKVPMKYTASWLTDNVYKAKKGETLKIRAKLIDIENKVSTDPTMMFIIRGNSIRATTEENTYLFNYTISENDVTVAKENDNKLTLSFAPVSSTEYTCNTIIANIEIDVEEEEKKMDGYVTGLYVKVATIDKTLMDEWVNRGITDLYIRLSDYTIVSYRKELEDALKVRKENNHEIRIHVAINCLYDIANKKSFDPTDSTRLKFIKEEIDYISTQEGVDGICLDCVRYMASDKNSSREAKITDYFKKMKEYIQSKNKNYVISGVVKAEDSDSWEYYGQKHKSIADQVDYIIPMVYKTAYASDGKSMDDTWAMERTKFILSAKPSVVTAAAESPPPIIVVPSASASAFATAIVPLANIGFSNTPIGPFQITVLADLTASA